MSDPSGTAGLNPFEGPSVREAPPEVAGVRALFYLRSFELAWYLLSSLGFWLAPPLMSALGSDAFSIYAKLNGIIWLLFAALGFALLFSFAEGRRGTGVESLARTVLVLAGVSLVLDLVQLVPTLGGPELLPGGVDLVSKLFSVAQFALFVSFELCFWLALGRSLVDPPRDLAPLFYGALALSTITVMAHVVLPFDEYREIFLEGAVAGVIQAVRLLTAVLRQAMVLILLRRVLVRGGFGAGVDVPPPPPAGTTRDLAIGSAWLLGGTLVTLISYAGASGGGRYLVTTGAIAYGLVRIVRGLARRR